ncbi:MAG: hypothetical protein FWE21_06570 [Defluviitaleaceae bacterium]|nr:hypothetical protein [Defluviitaleaceae bacterium]
MKKYLLTLLSALVVLFTFTACDTQDAENPQEYVIENNAPFLLRFDDWGFSFELPGLWRGNYFLTSFENEIARGWRAYHVATREEFGESEGLLFSIAKVHVEHDGPIGLILAERDEYVYIVSFPQDSPWSFRGTQNAHALEYLEMIEQAREYVVNSFILIPIIPIHDSTMDADTLENIFSLPNFSDGMVFVDDAALSSALFTAKGEGYPTHILFLWDIVEILGWEVIGAGGQNTIFRDGERLAEFSLVGYLAEFDVNVIGKDDPFSIFDMIGGMHINSYLPISLFRYMGYEAYFSNGNVYIRGF